MQCRTYIGLRPETVIFLCERSEETARPWKEAGYTTICIDLAVDGQAVRLVGLTDLLKILKTNGLKPYGVFAMPPCTHFAGSGARWWKEKGDAALLDALSISDACTRIAEALRSYGLQWHRPGFPRFGNPRPTNWRRLVAVASVLIILHCEKATNLSQ
jgi:hypothetical protein